MHSINSSGDNSRKKVAQTQDDVKTNTWGILQIPDMYLGSIKVCNN